MTNSPDDADGPEHSPGRSGKVAQVTASRACQLIVFCGRPGVGKTALSRRVADSLNATFLRIDTIEAAIVSTLMPFENNPVGYVVAGAVAADQLRSGRTVVADAVNNLQVARDAWAEVAARCHAPVRFVEVVCSDAAEHRRRVETRSAEMPGHGIPTWNQVQLRRWEPLTEPHLMVDNTGDASTHVTTIIHWLDR